MMETKVEHYCRSASLYLCSHVSCLQFVFRKLKATAQDIPYVSVWITAIWCVCICMCDFMLCGSLSMCWCLCVWLSICLHAHMTGFGPGRGVILQWSACNSRTEHRWEQRWTGSDQTETTRVILTDPLWHQQRCTKEVFYSIIFYTLSIFLSILCLTNTTPHSWQTPSVPK